ncbi:MAG: winged helix-turn-helix domain-containing protein [Candidatus Nanoarchaeia archaeon]|nr:winged helix-turn-helix domain-containing protein [Candidatus Nanoarchaeia archaeon]MDD5587978.1 winged helix-turn-helix domain-containing protein [Candidatus Nanoarchaeia archaeon]
MAEDKFLLVSLGEEKSKKLAQVISSDTARKIINLLAEKDFTETEIAERLNLPLTTAHYNTQQLEDAGLIESKGFKWSEKGKKIKYYQLVNKLIIVTPKSTKNFSDILKGILPVTLIGALGSLGIYLYEKSQLITTNLDSTGGQMLKSVTEEAVLAAPAVVQQSMMNYGLYFFIGVIFTTFLYIGIQYIKRKK